MQKQRGIGEITWNRQKIQAFGLSTVHCFRKRMNGISSESAGETGKEGKATERI